MCKREAERQRQRRRGRNKTKREKRNVRWKFSRIKFRNGSISVSESQTLKQHFSNLSMHLNPLVWGGAQKCAFITSSQDMLMLLVQVPHFDVSKCHLY